MNPEFNINQDSDNNKTTYGRTYEQHSGQINEVSLNEKYGGYVKILGLIILLLLGWMLLKSAFDKSVSQEVEDQVRTTVDDFNDSIIKANQNNPLEIAQSIAASDYVTSKFSREIDSESPEVVGCTDSMAQKMNITSIKVNGDDRVTASVSSGAKDFEIGLVNESGWKINTADCS